MGVPGSANFLLAGAQGYQIERSLRFNNPTDTVSLTRTPASAGNRRTWTWSAWVKRAGEMNGSTSGDYYQMLFTGNTAGSTDATFTAIFLYNNTLRVGGYATNWRISNALFRDPSAWYHFVIAVDTTDATANNRVRAYVNGTEITWATINNPTQNADWGINQAAAHSLGGAVSGSGQGLAGYLTEVNFIDGQALTPSSFGETNPITGVWQPKAFSGGSYGTNGFCLKFADNSGTTSTTLGKDSSPNSNNWTPNNFSVTAGSGNDSMIDTPTPYADGGNGRGNYCTLNPLDNPNTTYAFAQDGNLLANLGTGVGTFLSGTMHTLGGKYYWEFTPTTVGNGLALGITYGSTTTADANSKAIFYGLNGGKRIFGTDSAYGASYTNGDVIGVAVDGIAGTIEFFTNNTSQGVITDSSISLQPFRPFVFNNSSSANSLTVCNFGQRPFAYTPPAGFLALNTQNLPEPSIKKPSSYMDVVTYTGTGSALTPTTGIGFSPDLVWIKSRSAATDHALYDAVRGTEKRLESNNTDAEVTSDGGVTAFNSAGFSLGTLAQVNTNAATYAAWCWDESATPGFDIVTYTGNGTARTIAHSLGVAPSMMLVKRRDAIDNWGVYHTSLGNTQYLYLDSTQAANTASAVWNNTSPTSSVFSVGTSAVVNANTGTYVAYLWSEVAGFSKFDSYTGNGSTDGPFVYCGFRPRWVMIKNASGVGDWNLYDAARLAYNANDTVLFPNLSSAEQVNTGAPIDILSSGFKIRATAGNLNTSSSTYIFAAFAESPFKYSLAR